MSGLVPAVETTTPSDEALGLLPAGKPRSAARRGWEVFVQNRMAVVSLVFLIAVVLFCFFGPTFYHANETATNISLANLPPGGKGGPIGTDNSGFDELGRIMAGGQISLYVSIAAALVASVFGTVYGAVAGYVGGWLDAAMMRLVDAALSIPFLILLIVLATIVKPSELSMILIIAGVSWLATSRLIRGEALTLRAREYVQAVRTMGGGGFRIVFRHILPNAVGTIIVAATFTIADSMLLLSYLSFLGFGLQAPHFDWGAMLSNAVNYVSDGYWWQIYPVGVLLILVVCAFNFIGDALRDAFETRLQQR
jgi:peptide/nickel transport system permease protein